MKPGHGIFTGATHQSKQVPLKTEQETEGVAREPTAIEWLKAAYRRKGSPGIEARKVVIDVRTTGQCMETVCISIQQNSCRNCSR